MARNTSSSKRAHPKAAKAKGNGQAKKSTAKVRAAKPVPMTAEKISDAQRQHLAIQYKCKLVPLLATEAKAKGDVTKLYEQAKKEGITKTDLKLLIAFDTEEGEEGIRADLERTMRIARWTDSKIGKQLDLFGIEVPKGARVLDNIFESGKNAALRDEAPRAPGHLAQKQIERWLEGHSEGRRLLNAARGEGIKQLGMTSAAADLAVKAGVAGSLGTAPPTHVEEAPETPAHH